MILPLDMQYDNDFEEKLDIQYVHHFLANVIANVLLRRIFNIQARHKVQDVASKLGIHMAEKYGFFTGIEANKIGLNWVLAPVCDINNNPNNHNNHY